MGLLCSQEAASEWLSLTQQATGSPTGPVSPGDVSEVASRLLLRTLGLRPGQEGGFPKYPRALERSAALVSTSSAWAATRATASRQHAWHMLPAARVRRYHHAVHTAPTRGQPPHTHGRAPALLMAVNTYPTATARTHCAAATPLLPAGASALDSQRAATLHGFGHQLVHLKLEEGSAGA